MGVRVFTSRLIRSTLAEAELQSVVDKFRTYKECGDPGEYFGRDADLDRPRSAVEAALRHVHVNEGRPWHFRLLQFNRKSDVFLIYCAGHFNRQNFLLIEMLRNGHEKCRNLLYVAQLADLAGSFRERY